MAEFANMFCKFTCEAYITHGVTAATNMMLGFWRFSHAREIFNIATSCIKILLPQRSINPKHKFLCLSSELYFPSEWTPDFSGEQVAVGHGFLEPHICIFYVEYDFQDLETLNIPPKLQWATIKQEVYNSISNDIIVIMQ